MRGKGQGAKEKSLQEKDEKALNEALIDAARKGDEKLVTYYLSKRANINYQSIASGFTPLHWAAYQDHIKIVKLLLTRRAKITIKSRRGRTLLHDVVNAPFKSDRNYDLEKTRAIIHLLVDEYGVDVNAVDNSGETPYFYAVVNKIDVLETLKECGAFTENREGMKCVPEREGIKSEWCLLQ